MWKLKMKVQLVACCAWAAVVLAAAVPAGMSPKYPPLQNPELFGGDMLGIELDGRNAIPYNFLRWPQATVFYTIGPSLYFYRNRIRNVMNHYEEQTCIRFKERTNERDYLRIFAGEGCYSKVGKMGGAQDLSLGFGCLSDGIIMHELGHAIGFYHEHMRSDRNNYIVIYWQNIKAGMNDQFNKLGNSQNRLLDTFDYDSIMLYGSVAYSKDNKSWTMATINGNRLKEVSDKSALSKSDILRIKKLYQC